jgi:hypothetical protein
MDEVDNQILTVGEVATVALDECDIEAEPASAVGNARYLPQLIVRRVCLLLDTNLVIVIQVRREE